MTLNAHLRGGRRASHSRPGPRIALLSAVVAGAAFAAVPHTAFAQTALARGCPAPFGASSRERMTAPSFAGGPGLFEVPSATPLLDGDVVGAFNGAKLVNPDRRLLWQHNGAITVAFFPGLTVSAHGDVRHTGTGQDIFNRDKSANVQYLLFDEQGMRPALAAGMHDISGANSLRTAKYVALTKSLVGRVRLTAGYGSGVRLLDGPFGGVEVAPCPWVSLIAENDGRRHSAGVRLHLFPSLADKLGVRPTFDAAWLGDGEFTSAVGVRIAAGPARQHRPLAPTQSGRAASASFEPAVVPVTLAPRAVRDALAAAGLENVRVLPVQDGLLDVQYENRRWLLDDLDALGVVLGIVASRVPVEVTRVRTTIRKLDLPVLELTTALAPWRAFLADPQREGDFRAQLTVAFASPHRPPMEGAEVNASRFRVDLSARPRVETLTLSELGAYQARYAVLPEFTAQLGRGLAITGRRAIQAGQTSNFVTDLADAGADRLLLHAAARMPGGVLPKGALGVAQLSVGRLGQREVGAQWDQTVELPGGHWALGLTGAAYGETASRVEHSYVYGTLRWRRPEQELAASLQAGRYRFGDVGAVADVSRRFGLAEIGFFLRVTSLSSEAGVRAMVPLSPRRQLRPGPVRVVLPDYFEHIEDQTVFEPIPIVRTDVARSLDTGFGVERVYAGRGWLNEATVRARVWAIRNAALREHE